MSTYLKNYFKGSYQLFKKSKNIQDVDRNISKLAFKYGFDEFEGIFKSLFTR